MLMFAIVNAGVSLAFDDFSTSVTMAVFVGLVLGKPIGTFMFN